MGRRYHKISLCRRECTGIIGKSAKHARADGIPFHFYARWDRRLAGSLLIKCDCLVYCAFFDLGLTRCMGSFDLGLTLCMGS